MIEYETSYVVCEDLVPTGRMSFKKFNPAVEVSLAKPTKSILRSFFHRIQSHNTTIGLIGVLFFLRNYLKN
jgi:hypothetical protein